MTTFDWRDACLDAERRYQELARDKIALTKIATSLYNLALSTYDKNITDEEYNKLYTIAINDYQNYFEN